MPAHQLNAFIVRKHVGHLHLLLFEPLSARIERHLGLWDCKYIWNETRDSGATRAPLAMKIVPGQCKCPQDSQGNSGPHRENTLFPDAGVEAPVAKGDVATSKTSDLKANGKGGKVVKEDGKGKESAKGSEKTDGKGDKGLGNASDEGGTGPKGKSKTKEKVMLEKEKEITGPKEKVAPKPKPKEPKAKEEKAKAKAREEREKEKEEEEREKEKVAAKERAKAKAKEAKDAKERATAKEKEKATAKEKEKEARGTKAKEEKVKVKEAAEAKAKENEKAAAREKAAAKEKADAKEKAAAKDKAAAKEKARSRSKEETETEKEKEKELQGKGGAKGRGSKKTEGGDTSAKLKGKMRALDEEMEKEDEAEVEAEEAAPSKKLKKGSRVQFEDEEDIDDEEEGKGGQASSVSKVKVKVAKKTKTRSSKGGSTLPTGEEVAKVEANDDVEDDDESVKRQKGEKKEKPTHVPAKRSRPDPLDAVENPKAAKRTRFRVPPPAPVVANPPCTFCASKKILCMRVNQRSCKACRKKRCKCMFGDAAADDDSNPDSGDEEEDDPDAMSFQPDINERSRAMRRSTQDNRSSPDAMEVDQNQPSSSSLMRTTDGEDNDAPPSPVSPAQERTAALNEQQYMLNEMAATFQIMRHDSQQREELRREVQALTRRADGSDLQNLDRIHENQAVQRDLAQANQSHSETHHGLQYQLSTHTGQIDFLRNNLNTINALVTQSLLAGASPDNEVVNGVVTHLRAPFPTASGPSDHTFPTRPSIPHTVSTPPPPTDLYLPFNVSAGLSTGMAGDYGESAGTSLSTHGDSISAQMRAFVNLPSSESLSSYSPSAQQQKENQNEGN
ncbi:hypothetical protein BKA70DRAFT_1240373 [Coprinopsis sp. MPI-PUGE-AT-0042]|nr:hypothetical protein BKA70DRAFT_1240373 [Coprinopsis sp. MPI-PUGE-AT-0042]